MRPSGEPVDTSIVEAPLQAANSSVILKTTPLALALGDAVFRARNINHNTSFFQQGLATASEVARQNILLSQTSTTAA